MTNRLADETSPYLLQHAENPVHWRAWSPEALSEAKAATKPILLSVGYAACHWCHVMAHESFEDVATAKVMNRLFVNIKVDREERPDIDTIYMAALHTLGEQGGWPLTMFLTPDGAPFWGGTYFPNTERFGRPSFVRVLNEVSRIFSQEPEKVLMNAKLITTRLKQGSESQKSAVEIGDGLLRQSARQILDHMDMEHGGLRGAPKFPQYTLLWFLWRSGIRYNTVEYLDAVTLTLERICQGGIYDHLGGGFARYSVDERWLAPHFEKMLYDNALLLLLLSDAWRETQSELFAERIAETIGWLEREMRMPDGGFVSSLDADSEGEEGKFYVWSEDEIVAALGAENAAFFGSVYDVGAGGNWEGKVILNRLNDHSILDAAGQRRLAALRNKLLELRESRIRPGLDDKVLADWNGLTIAALVQCAQSFDQNDWLALARDAYRFVASAMIRNERLIHSWRNVPSSAPGYSSDYANMILAALELFQATGEAGFLVDARRWTTVLDEHYWFKDAAGYAMTADDTETLIVRTRAAHDDATPNANAIMLGNLVALFQLTGDADYLSRAEALLASFSGDIAGNPIGHTGIMGRAMDLLAPQMLAIVGGQTGQPERLFHSVLRHMSLPGMAVQTMADTTHFTAGTPLAGKAAKDGQPTAYFCSGGTCSLPVTEPEALEDLLRAGREASLPAG